MIIIKRNNMSLVAGEVTACKEGSGNAAGKVVNVTIKNLVWNKETKSEEEKTLEIAFWNSEDRQLADRVIKAKVGVGSFITALVVIKDENPEKGTGINFKYSGLWKFPADEKTGEKEMNVFVGTVASLDSNTEKGYAKVSVPVTNISGETEWHSVTFWNNEKAAMADRAAKCLSPRANGEKVRAILVCGKAGEYNGKPAYTGFRFELIR